MDIEVEEDGSCAKHGIFPATSCTMCNGKDAAERNAAEAARRKRQAPKPHERYVPDL